MQQTSLSACLRGVLSEPAHVFSSNAPKQNFGVSGVPRASTRETESSSRRFDGGLQNAIFAFQPPWYKFQMP